MSPRLSKTSFGFLFTAGAIPLVAYSQVYLNEDQAAQEVFPKESFTRKTLELTPDDIKKIEEKSGERVRNTSLVLLISQKKNVLFVDQVLGKHEFITYVVGITPQKKVQGIEILEYRETYGSEVQKPEWKKQFVGKDATSPLKLGKDVINISGATLSSAHITAGVRRILQTYETIRERI